ncbi:GNAT family N-acetyltransferase [Chthonobacter albigriseus]|uniref:GNAT family N-acetyltransferase n=1 Tax=Chthonobacter albigriseus TaxID=1683161 RepID=UPI0015EE489F|nr:GNAT family N-acetyltransferase [Chthonobacter albigriseus]
MTDIRLRTAAPSDRLLLEAWDQAPHVVENAGTDGGMDWAFELPRTVDWREILIAEEDRRPIGVVIIIDAAREESHYWGDAPAGVKAIDIWIGEADAIGRGFGTEMMTAAIGRCFADPETREVWIDPLEANHRGRRFYERLGFQAVGPRRFADDDCMVYRIARADWEGRRGS